MKKPKPRKTPNPKSEDGPVMLMPRQTTDEIWRRREIREELHDLKAKTLRGKQR